MKQKDRGKKAIQAKQTSLSPAQQNKATALMNKVTSTKFKTGTQI